MKATGSKLLPHSLYSESFVVLSSLFPPFPPVPHLFHSWKSAPFAGPLSFFVSFCSIREEGPELLRVRLRLLCELPAHQVAQLPYRAHAAGVVEH
jgi:hypothetical protein